MDSVLAEIDARAKELERKPQPYLPKNIYEPNKGTPEL